MANLLSSTKPVARKSHRCDECGHMVPPGVRYIRQFVKDGGDVWDWKMHEDCAEAADYQFREDGGDYDDGRSPLVEYENNTGYFPDWLRGYWPHVVCRLEFWKQKKEPE